MGVVEEEEVGQGEEALVEVSWGEEGGGGGLSVHLYVGCLKYCHISFVVEQKQISHLISRYHAKNLIEYPADNSAFTCPLELTNRSCLHPDYTASSFV